MSWEIVFVFATILVALALFISERYPVDQVSLAIPVVLLLAGILTPAEAIAGFSSEATVTVAAMLVLSLGLVKTGAVAEIGRWAQSGRLGGAYARLVLLSAVAMGRTGFGLLLIVAFSIVLASVLIGIGLLIVYARRLMARVGGDGLLLTRWLPLTSAAVVTLLGVAIALQAMGAGFVRLWL